MKLMFDEPTCHSTGNGSPYCTCSASEKGTKRFRICTKHRCEDANGGTDGGALATPQLASYCFHS